MLIDIIYPFTYFDKTRRMKDIVYLALWLVNRYRAIHASSAIILVLHVADPLPPNAQAVILVPTFYPVTLLVLHVMLTAITSQILSACSAIPVV